MTNSLATVASDATFRGNLGVWPGLAVVGFPPGIVTPPGGIHPGDAVAQQAQNDVTTAYNGLANMPFDSNLSGQDLGGLTLASGVYLFDSSAQLTGTLTLDAQGFNNAYWVFQIGSPLTTASASARTAVPTTACSGRSAARRPSEQARTLRATSWRSRASPSILPRPFTMAAPLHGTGR